MKKVMIGSTVEARGFYGHRGIPGHRGGSLPRSGGGGRSPKGGRLGEPGRSFDQAWDVGEPDKTRSGAISSKNDRPGESPERLDKVMLSWMKKWYRVNQKSAKRTGKKFNVSFRQFVQNPTAFAVVGEPRGIYGKEGR